MNVLFIFHIKSLLLQTCSNVSSFAKGQGIKDKMFVVEFHPVVTLNESSTGIPFPSDSTRRHKYDNNKYFGHLK